jgi:4'-phosphopantetheinyl transferase
MEIYAVKIADIASEQIAKLSEFIDPKKRNRIEKFVQKEDKIRTLIGEILIRSVMIQKYDIDNEDLVFQENEYGKPSLINFPHVFFNVSHSGDFVVCAFDDFPVGIDIEKIKDIEYVDIAGSFFTPKECEYMIKSDSNQQINKFYDLWALKESYIKCCGKGLSLPLQSFSVEINGPEDIRICTDNGYTEHTLRMIEIESEYRMAVCVLNKHIHPITTIINQNNLIHTYDKMVC